MSKRIVIFTVCILCVLPMNAVGEPNWCQFPESAACIVSQVPNCSLTSSQQAALAGVFVAMILGALGPLGSLAAEVDPATIGAFFSALGENGTIVALNSGALLWAVQG